MGGLARICKMYGSLEVSDGSIHEPIQAKILYNGNCHF